MFAFIKNYEQETVKDEFEAANAFMSAGSRTKEVKVATDSKKKKYIRDINAVLADGGF
jgi:phosphoribosylformylglycinamidine (FGAM) synthase-like amidotransferase family enzyme